jgi:hypothetical protein
MERAIAALALLGTGCSGDDGRDRSGLEDSGDGGGGSPEVILGGFV